MFWWLKRGSIGCSWVASFGSKKGAFLDFPEAFGWGVCEILKWLEGFVPEKEIECLELMFAFDLKKNIKRNHPKS